MDIRNTTPKRRIADGPCISSEPQLLYDEMRLDESLALWHASSTEFPPLGARYSPRAQQEREALFDRCLHAIQAESLNIPATRLQREKSLARITSAFAEFAKSALDLDDACVALLLPGGFSGVGSDLARQARRFDPSASIDDVLQACRNAWTACGLQALLGQAMRLTPAIFAYSMLYPYSDNYLDEVGISREAKLAFSARFRCRLAGNVLPPENVRETAVWRLIDLIEAQYDRSDYPQVYASLLAIHGAQEDSVRQLHRSLHNDDKAIDILRLSFAKGGASVLADAYLAAGSLTPLEARFAFQWGVVLQLSDDLQDLEQDRQRGSLTLFSQAAEREPLDKLTNRLMQFALTVTRQMEHLPNAPEPLKELLIRSSRSLLIRAAGNLDGLYTRPYLSEVESYSPFRFSFLKDRNQQIASRSKWYEKLFEAFLAGEGDEPSFPILSLSPAAP